MPQEIIATRPKHTFLSVAHHEYQQQQAMKADAQTVFGLTFAALFFAVIFTSCIILAGKRVTSGYQQSDRDRKREIARSCDNEIARLEAMMK